MLKKIFVVIILGYLASCIQANYNGIPYNANTGDVGTVSAVQNDDGSITYDFTGLGLTDENAESSGGNVSEVVVFYYTDGTITADGVLDIDIVTATKTFWDLNIPGIDIDFDDDYRYIESKTSFYKQTFNMPIKADDLDYTRISISRGWESTLYFEGAIENGTGTVTCVGNSHEYD